MMRRVAFFACRVLLGIFPGLIPWSVPVFSQPFGNSETRLYAISGRVTLGTTEVGIGGCRLFLYRGSLHELAQTVSDWNGNFALGLLRLEPGPVRFLVAPPHEFFEIPNTEVDLGEKQEVEVRIKAGCLFPASSLKALTLEGSVRAGSGETPLQGVEVRLSRDETYDIGKTRSDRKGFYHLHSRNLPPGRYDLEVRTGNGLLRDASRTLVLGSEDLYREVDFHLPVPGGVSLNLLNLSGRVFLKPMGGPGVAGVPIALGTRDRPIVRLSSGGGGHFLADQVYAPPGLLWLRVGAGNPFVKERSILLNFSPRDRGIGFLRADVTVSPDWPLVLLLGGGLVLLGVLLFFVCGRWLLPEWKAIIEFREEET